jgi:hypothetical protein
MEEACRRRLPACLPCRCPCASSRAFSLRAGCSRLLRPSLFIGDGDMHASSTYIIHASRVQDHHHEAFWLDRQGMTDEMSTSGGQAMHTIEELERNIYRPRSVDPDMPTWFFFYNRRSPQVRNANKSTCICGFPCC